MLFSADISPDDHRNFIYFGEPACDEDGSEDRADWSVREWVFFLLLSVCGVGVIGYLLYSKGMDHWIQHPVLSTVLVILLLFLCLLFGATLQARAIHHRWDGDKLDHTALREGFNLGEARFDLRPDGFSVTFPLVRNFYAWQGFHGLGEGPDAFYLMFSEEGDGIIVPKRAFADEVDRESFKHFVASRVGGRE